MTRRPWWSVNCPVCLEPLPERGNRRVYVPWKRAFKLVHDGACADAIDAQGVLDLTPPKRRRLSPVQLVRARQHAENLRNLLRDAERSHEHPAANDDALAVECRKMSDAELRTAIESIRGNSKRAGSRARRLNDAESVALAALMAEEARRV